jgi:pimeloyl-ACP methyl ester carboxylesterase
MQFVFLFKRLSKKGYRVIAYDMRGHGKSSSAKTYTEMDFTSDLVIVLNFFQCTGVTIIGYGFGGFVAQCLFHNEPSFASEKVHRLVLLSSFSVAPCSVVEQAFLAGVSSGLVHIICKIKFLSRLIGRRMFGHVANTTMLEAWRRGVLNSRASTWIKAMSAAKSDLRQLGFCISIPTIIVCGDRDAFYRRSQKSHFPHVQGAAELVWLERMGHMTPWEAPDRLTSIVCRFVPSDSSCSTGGSRRSRMSALD